jgi:hypothetical protein
VRPQVARRVERLFAPVALVRSLVLVSLIVFTQAVRPGEFFTAKHAHVRPFVVMLQLVQVQFTGHRKSLATQVALERFLERVKGADVAQQVLFSFERPSTVSASFWRLYRRVCRHSCGIFDRFCRLFYLDFFNAIFFYSNFPVCRFPFLDFLQVQTTQFDRS